MWGKPKNGKEKIMLEKMKQEDPKAYEKTITLARWAAVVIVALIALLCVICFVR